MPTIRKRPDGQYEFTVDLTPINGRRNQKHRVRPTEREAKAELKRLLAEDATGRPTLSSNPQVAEFSKHRHLPALEADPRLKATTVSSYRYSAKHLVRALGRVRLRDLSGDQLTVLYGQLRAAGKSERTVRAVHVYAHRMLKDAGRLRLVAYNAADDAVAPAQSIPNPRAWSADEVARFLGAASTNRWWSLWLVAATTGLRRGELAAMRWRDLEGNELVVCRNRVVVDHRVVEHTPKNNRSRRIALDPDTLEALRQWKATQAAERLVIGSYWQAEDYCWTWPDGTLLHPAVISRTFVRLVTKAGVPRLSLHNLRHAWATNALLSGVVTKVVSGRLGHSSTRITEDIYTAATPSLDGAAALGGLALPPIQNRIVTSV